MIKSSVIAAFTLLFSLTTINDNQIDRLGVKGPLEFDQTKFELSWTDKPSDSYYIQEYLPHGETSASFNQMLTIHLFDMDIKIEDAVKQKVMELTERKKTDAVCNYQVTESPDGKEYIVDFLLGESKDGIMTIIEFNVYHYKKVEVAKKKKVIVVYAYTKRSYGDDITSFMKGLGAARTNYLKQMISAEIPAINIGKSK